MYIFLRKCLGTLYRPLLKKHERYLLKKDIWRRIIMRQYAKGFFQDWRLVQQKQSRQAWVSLTRHGEHTMRALLNLDVGQKLLENAKYPLVSCLMPTQNDRFQLAQRAVECFLKQTYPNKEMIIVDDSMPKDFGRWVNSLRDSRIKYIGLEEKKILGELRNITVENAQGEYIAHWDDDDLSHPNRLMLQMQAMFMTNADGSFLTTETLWWPDRRLLVEARSCPGWQNTMVLRKSKAVKYHAVKYPTKEGEDSIFVREIIPKTDIITFDAPRLYLRLVHGNTWDEKHFENLLRMHGEIRYTLKYGRVLDEFSKEYGVVLDKRTGIPKQPE